MKTVERTDTLTTVIPPTVAILVSFLPRLVPHALLFPLCSGRKKTDSEKNTGEKRRKHPPHMVRKLRAFFVNNIYEHRTIYQGPWSLQDIECFMGFNK